MSPAPAAPVCFEIPEAAPALFDGALGAAVERWRLSREPMELWLRGEGNVVVRLCGGPRLLDLRAWSGSRLMVSASIRGAAGSEAFCAESGGALTGLALCQRAQAAFDTLSDCSSRCALCERPSWLRRALLG